VAADLGHLGLIEFGRDYWLGLLGYNWIANARADEVVQQCGS